MLRRSTAAIATIFAAALLPAAASAQTAPASAPTAPRAPMASQQPIPLFKAVCIDGTAALSRKWASATNYAAMPEGARAVVGQPVMSVPNPVYQIGGGNEYLIVPAAESTMPFGPGCAVVWQGSDLAAAQKVAASASIELGVSATAEGGWILLKSLPIPAKAEPVR
jgi:hypothetical protein